MDKATAKALMAEAQRAMDEVFARHGMKTSGVRASYDAGSIKITVSGEQQGDESPRVLDWKRYAGSYSLPEDALGKTIVYQGRAFKITGLAASRRRYPVTVTEILTGKDLLLTVDAARRGLGLID